MWLCLANIFFLASIGYYEFRDFMICVHYYMLENCIFEHALSS